MFQNLSIINVDWVQCFCKRNIEDFAETKSKFIVKKLEYQSRHFKDLYSINLGKQEVAVLQTNPHSKIINTGDTIIKISNKYLYQKNIHLFVENLLKELNLDFVSISRIDICVDMQTFNNQYDCEKMIQDFTSGKIIKHGKSKVKLQGFQSDILHYDYLKFGSNTSEISYYLYNKSKELREVKLKPYIIDMWANNGFDITKDTWRLEFTIKKTQKGLLDSETGEDLQIPMNSLKTLIRANFEKIIKVLIQKKWKFSTKKLWEKTTEKYRVKAIQLFSFANEAIDFFRVSEKLDSNRMDKIFIKKLERLKLDFTDGTPYFINELETISAYFRRTRGLNKYNTT